MQPSQCFQVYSQDMDRTVEMILSLMHNDLTANTLALLLTVLPRLLCTPGMEDRLTHPAGPALAKLTVLSLAAALRPVLGKRRSREAELDLCDDVTTPIKLRRLGGKEYLGVVKKKQKTLVTFPFDNNAMSFFHWLF